MNIAVARNDVTGIYLGLSVRVKESRTSRYANSSGRFKQPGVRDSAVLAPSQYRTPYYDMCIGQDPIGPLVQVCKILWRVSVLSTTGTVLRSTNTGLSFMLVWRE